VDGIATSASRERAFFCPGPSHFSTALMSSVAKSIELLAEGDSLEAATEAAVAEASRTIDDIRSVYVDNYRAVVDDGQIQSYRVHAKITFVIQEGTVA